MQRPRLTYNPSTSNRAQRGGERVWKMSGEVQSMSINGQTVIDYVALDRKTLYTNPYLIVTEAEYTKHYYAESQRIASKLGGGWAQAGYNPLGDHVPETPNFYYSELNNQLIDRLLENAKCVGVHDARYYDAFEAVYNQLSADDPEVNQYFYHPDHLGSSSFITNASGNVDQHLQYLPFGEPWIDQRTQNNIRFTFSGKERDEETGYNYFGARYYHSDVSIWLSVDPLSDQAPGWTPYRYGFNNPLKFTDPTGLFETNDEEMNHYQLNEVTVSASRNSLMSNRTSMLSAGVSNSHGNYTLNSSNTNSKVDQFFYGLADGFGSGISSTVDFFSSLGTEQGWKDLGQGMMDMAMLGCQTCPQGMLMRNQMADRTVDYIQNIPNLTAYEFAHDIGFGTVKALEIALTRRVAPLPKSALGIRNVGDASRFSTIQTVQTYGKWGKFNQRHYTWPTGGYTMDKATYYNRNFIIPVGRVVGTGQLQHIQNK